MNEEISSRNLIDPFIDATLMHFMKYRRRHIPGSSKKQVRRINQASKRYDYYDGKILINRKGLRVEIPQKGIRENLIKRFHATDFSEKFFWFNARTSSRTI